MELTHAKKWFVMRDLKRHNALHRAYAALAGRGLEVYTPMKWQVSKRGVRKVREKVPVIPDLVFVHEAKPVIDPIVAEIPTLQFRYQRGHSIDEPMTVREADMSRFIRAAETDGPLSETAYYTPEEITPAMLGRQVRIIGGTLDGYEGRLLKMRGTRRRRLLVELPGFLVAAVEVEPEFIQMVE